jgi:D-psicose/D-tagatose/L-ribulose 3-epimerase
VTGRASRRPDRQFDKESGTKIGVNTFIWSADFDRTSVRMLGEIRRMGFDGVELPLIRPRELPVAEIRTELAATGLEPTFCAILPPGLDSIGPDAGVRQKTRMFLGECVEIAAGLGGSILCGPVYAPVGKLTGRRRTADEWSRAVECFQSLGDTLSGHGITLCIEPLNRFETYFLNTTADAVALCRAVGHPNIGVLLGHVSRQHRTQEYRRVHSRRRPVDPPHSLLRERPRNCGQRPLGVERDPLRP